MRRTHSGAVKALLGPLGGAVAAALAVMLVMLGRQPVEPWTAILIAAGAGVLILGLGAAELVVSPPQIHVIRLPGFVTRSSLPDPRIVRAGAGVVLAVLLLTGSWSPIWLVVLVLTLAFALLGSVLVWSGLRRSGRRAEQRMLRAALEKHAPQFVLYTGRRNDATYQLTMWLPLLEELGVPYAVIVRDSQAVDLAAQVTDAPVISCPTASDLDCVVVDSIKAAFYVNMVAENTNFVLYRSMTHVYLGHGDSDKELSGHPAHAMFDQVFVAGPAARERYVRNAVVIPDEKFVVIGRPQLADTQTAAGPVGRAANPTVLVAPTWRGYNSRTTLSSMEVAPALVDLLIARGASVVFRPHPFSWQGRDDRRQISAVDERLRVDRAASGRKHVLASEQRARTVSEVFDLSDALVTDIGSLLVDYYVTKKPYAVVLPSTLTPDEARQQFPTLEAAYLVESAALKPLDGGGSDGAGSDWLDGLLVSDPLAARRLQVSRRYLGDRPGDIGPFLEAVHRILET